MPYTVTGPFGEAGRAWPRNRRLRRARNSSRPRWSAGRRRRRCSPMRRDQPVRQQMQPQVGVVGIGRLVVERRDRRAHQHRLDVAFVVSAFELCERLRHFGDRGRLVPDSPSARVRETTCREPFRRPRWWPRRRLMRKSRCSGYCPAEPTPTPPVRRSKSRAFSSHGRPTWSVLDLRADPIALTAALVDIPSESRHERRIADEIEAALRAQAPSFEIIRNGDAVLARTSSAARRGCCWPDTPTPCPPPTICRAGSSTANCTVAAPRT